jgi:peroxiredoxin
VPTKGVKIVNESELMRSSGGIDLTGKAAQDFALPDLQGNQVSLSQFKGKVVVLDFWATWCPPCRKEMPELQTLFEKYKDKDVQVIAVSTDDTTEPVEAFVKDNSISFLVLHGSRDEMRAIDQFYKITAIPRVLIIDREGVIKADITGYEEGRIGKELEKLTQ